MATQTPPDQTPKNLTWPQLLLADLGAQDNLTNEIALLLWTKQEWGGSQSWSTQLGTTSYNNPLAISTKFPGAQNCLAQCGTGSEIYSYDTMTNGVAATAAFIKQNDPGLITIFNQTIQGTNPSTGKAQPDISGLQSIWQYVNKSGWCRGCAGGLYPSTLYDAINNPNTLGAVNSELNGLATAGTAITNAATSVAKGAASAATGAASLYSSLGSILGDITSGNFWLRVGLGFLGLLLAIVGVLLILSTTKTGQTVEGGLAVASL